MKINGTPHTLVGLGELLWDVFPSGKRMGGAPANFAFHAASLGARGIAVSQVGDDGDGLELRHGLETLGLEAGCVFTDPSHATGRVLVELRAGGEPAYDIVRNAAWDHLAWSDALSVLAAEADAVCFGTLAQRSPVTRETVRRFLREVRAAGGLRVLDLNLRRPFHDPRLIRESLALCDMAKLNEDELLHVAGLLNLDPRMPPRTQTEIIREHFGLGCLCVTRGGAGSLLATQGGVSEHPGIAVVPADTVGAGDAFTAALVHFHLLGKSPGQINEAANRLGSWVAGRHGATPAMPAEIRTWVSDI